MGGTGTDAGGTDASGGLAGRGRAAVQTCSGCVVRTLKFELGGGCVRPSVGGATAYSYEEDGPLGVGFFCWELASFTETATFSRRESDDLKTTG
jgi:hypothetical protein